MKDLKNEITENKKLIAEFMGLKKDKESSLWFYNLNKGSYIKETDLQDNSSWDWLMPVAIKCVNINLDEYLMLNKDGYKNILDTSFEIASDPKEYLYKEVIEFINWYNKNKER